MRPAAQVANERAAEVAHVSPHELRLDFARGAFGRVEAPSASQVIVQLHA